MEPDNNPPSEYDDSLKILKNRLAKGEITVKEFEEIKKKVHDICSTDSPNKEKKSVAKIMFVTILLSIIAVIFVISFSFSKIDYVWMIFATIVFGIFIINLIRFRNKLCFRFYNTKNDF